jgi:hypothetical protein
VVLGLALLLLLLIVKDVYGNDTKPYSRVMKKKKKMMMSTVKSKIKTEL